MTTIALLTSLIVHGASLSSTLYDSLGEAHPLFDAVNDVNALLSRLLPSLLDPRRLRGLTIGRHVEALLMTCKDAYDEINVADLEEEVGVLAAQLRKRLEGVCVGLELVLAVLGGVASERRADAALSGAGDIRTEEDTAAAALEPRSVDVEEVTYPVHAEGSREGVRTDEAEVSDQPEAGTARDDSEGVIEQPLVASVPNLKEVIPATSGPVIDIPAANGLVLATAPEESTDDIASEDIDEPNDPQQSDHLSPPASPNPKEIIDESIRRSFQFSRRDEEDALAQEETRDHNHTVLEQSNIKEDYIPESKMSFEEGKSIQRVPKTIPRNSSERLGDSSTSREAQATVIFPDAEPASLLTIVAAPKPAIPISETEALPGGQFHTEEAVPYPRTENTATETWSSTFETSESSSRGRITRTSTATSMDNPPSLMSDSASSVTSLPLPKPSEEKEAIDGRPPTPQPPPLVKPDIDVSISTKTLSSGSGKSQGSSSITLKAVLNRETKPPYSMNNFFVYMRDDMKAIDLLDCWLEIKQHNDLCTFFVLERLSDVTSPTPQEISKYIRSLFSHSHTHTTSSAQHIASIAIADANHGIRRADLTGSAERIYYTYLVPGESDRDVTVYLSREVREGVREDIGVKGWVDPGVFEGVWGELEGRMEKDMFPGFMKKRRVLRHRLFKGMP